MILLNFLGRSSHQWLIIIKIIILLFISSSSPVDFLFCLLSDIWPALRVMINRKSSRPTWISVLRDGSFRARGPELLLAPSLWFPLFGNKLVEMCSQVSCSADVLRQECWGLRSPQATLPWIPHTSLHRTSTRALCTISGWFPSVASTKTSLGSSTSCGVTTSSPHRKGLGVRGHLPKLPCPGFASLTRLALFPPLTQRNPEE